MPSLAVAEFAEVEATDPLISAVQQGSFNFDSRMTTVVAELQEEVRGLDNLAERLEGAAKQVRSQISRHQRALRSLEALAPSASQPARTMLPNPSAETMKTGFSIAFDKCVEGGEHLRRMVATKVTAGEAAVITQKEFYRDIDWDQAKASQLFKYLRSIEFLRFAGKISANGSKCDSYAIMDDQALEREAEKRRNFPSEYRQALITADIHSGDAHERAAAFMREVGEVKGWAALAQGIGISEHRALTIGKRLTEYSIIEVIRPKKKGSERVTIRYIAQATETVEGVAA